MEDGYIQKEGQDGTSQSLRTNKTVEKKEGGQVQKGPKRMNWAATTITKFKQN
ncbi:Hypothetical protein FKW44_019577 [Caligus rogercresseyi]|uniref:Uncharacterized protein n=1 Tax=Caligus rogercresseyi TaxID=217165 RepID=A0A7T8GW14_CALRO|nr:Hypothetical protein FKW44_019577 [Caligus rogercresseyi]